MSTPVQDGRATIPIDTTGLAEGQYKIEVNYTDGNYYNNTSVENSILTLEPVVWTEIGAGTDTPWISSMMRGGTISNGQVWIDFSCNPMILNSVIFNADFEIQLNMGMNCISGTYYFGFTTQPTTVQSELTVNNTNMNNTTTFPALFPVANQTETITVKREGNTYTLTHNNQSYTCTVQSAQPVYLYIFKNGNCSTYLEKIRYKGGGQPE